MNLVSPERDPLHKVFRWSSEWKGEREFSLNPSSQGGQSKQDATQKGFDKSGVKQWKSLANSIGSPLPHRSSNGTVVGLSTRWHPVPLSFIYNCTRSPQLLFGLKITDFIPFPPYQEPYFGILSGGTQDASVIIYPKCLGEDVSRAWWGRSWHLLDSLPLVSIYLLQLVSCCVIIALFLYALCSFLSEFLSPTLGLLSLSYRISSFLFHMGVIN